MCYLREVGCKGWEFSKLDWVVAPTSCAMLLCDFSNKLLHSVNGTSLLLHSTLKHVIML